MERDATVYRRENSGGGGGHSIRLQIHSRVSIEELAASSLLEARADGHGAESAVEELGL